jgi:hypothetical protein
LRRPYPSAEKSGKRPRMEFSFTEPRFILCEGHDDKGFIETLLQEHGLPGFQVCHSAECNTAGPDGKGVGGTAGFKHSLAGFRPIKGFGGVRAILIVTDNDDANSFSDVQDALTENGHTAPQAANQIGAVHGKPTAILMLPSPAQHGDLEKLCFPEIARTWPNADACVRDFLACTGANRWRRASSINKARARAATVGFNEDDPYKGIGHLFRNRTLSTTNPCFAPIVQFFRDFDAMMGI